MRGFAWPPFAVCFNLIIAASALGAANPIGPGDFIGTPDLITFETDTSLPTDVPVPGVTFVSEGSSRTGGPDWFFGTTPRIPVFGAQSYVNVYSSQPGVFSNLAVAFATPQQAVGAYVKQVPNSLDDSAEIIDFRALDASNAILFSERVSLPLPADAPLWLGVMSDVPIARVEWSWVEPGFFGVDNITYGQAPEPASIVLVIAGGAVAMARRRPFAGARCTRVPTHD